MAQNNFTIKVKIWDKWEIDTYTMNGYRFYAIIEIGNKLYLMERLLDEL
jgi:hypothetical protein